VDAVLVEQEAVDDLGVLDAAARLLREADVVGLDRDVAVLFVGDGADRLHGDGSQRVEVTARQLARHRRASDLLEDLVVVDVDLGREVVEDLLGALGGQVEPARDQRGVDVVEQVLGLVEELTGEHDAAGRTVANLLLEALGDLDHHLGRGVLDVDLVEDGDAIVRDDDVTHRVDEHLVHPSGTERGANGVADSSGSLDVVALGVLALAPIRALGEHDERLTLFSSHSLP
jgi:hypothetical protein